MNTALKKMKSLVKQFTNKEFRQSYVDSHTKLFLATQIRTLRGECSQKEFAKKLGTTQSVVSRYENPDYGQVSMTTLLDIAFKLDIALVVRFVNYVNFLQITNDLSEEAIKPKPFDKEDFNALFSTHSQLELKSDTASPNYMAVYNVGSQSSGSATPSNIINRRKTEQ